jgi:hypothetical protein
MCPDCTGFHAVLASAQAKEPARKGDETAANSRDFQPDTAVGVDALTTRPHLIRTAEALIARP